MFAMGSEIRSIHLDPTVTSQPFPPIGGLQGAVGLDYDYSSATMYFSQTKAKKISKISIGSQTIVDIAVNENSTGEVGE